MNLTERKKNRLPVLYFMIPVLVALFIRIIFYLSWANSTFKYYSFVKGLDMQTLLKWGIDSATKGETANNLYVFLLSLIVKLTNGSIFAINTIIILQLLFGIGTVFLSAYIAWIISDSKITACISGILVSCYAPLLMYEGFILKSTICVFLTTGLFLTSLLFYKKIEYRQITSLISGLLADMLLFANFASLCLVLFFFLWQIFITFKLNLSIKNLLIYPLTVFIMLVLLFSATGFRFFPIVTNIADKRWLAYVINVGHQREITTLNESVQSLSEQPSDKIINIYPYLKKSFFLLSSAEAPDNINYYFVRDGLFPLKYMISPFLLYLFGIPAFFFYLSLHRGKKISLMCGFGLASLAIPLIIFVPLSRYTITYAPLLCVFSSWLVCELTRYIKQKDTKITLFIVLILLISFIFQKKLNPAPFFRGSDFVAFAKALEIRNPGDPRIPYAYEEAYKIDTGSVSIALKYTDMLMAKGRFFEASDILERFHNTFPSNMVISLQLSSALLGCGKTDKAGILLTGLSIMPIADDPLYFYNKAEYFFQKKNYKEALTLYEKLKPLNIPAIQEKITLRILFIKEQIVKQ